MNYPIQIVRVKSRSVGKEYFIAYPSADVDYLTNGMLILVSVEKYEIQLHNADGEEYELGPYDGGLVRARKENEKQNRSDLRVASIDLNTRASPESCEEFAYHDIFDSNGHSDAIEKVSVDEFIKLGGVLKNEI